MKTEIESNRGKTMGKWQLIDEYSYIEPLSRAARLEVEVDDNPTLRLVKGRVDKNTELMALWTCSNVIAVNRLGYSDHGLKHVEIVVGHALRIQKLLNEAGIKPSCMGDYGLSYDDAEVITFLGACLHDIGHSIHRDNHSQYGIWLAIPIINKLLEGIYPQETLTYITSEVLHCIAVHHKDSRPLTIEAGILRVSDALDMAHGRTRLWDESRSNSNIHAISARAIDSVEIVKGTSKPITIKISMSGSAGVFQIDELLRPKLMGSGIQDYVQVDVHVSSENSLVNDFTL
jgi:metal-dependent HD superfamily phosphatase/phosphodiesterase